MKLSVCVPQYNRIQFLLKSLAIIEKQQYEDIEVVISDDCSTDDTEIKINALMQLYKYPLVYYRSEINRGYDWNFRKSVELSSGDYVIVLGNDDTLNPDLDIGNLIFFLKNNNYPEIGFSNYLEESSGNTFIKRAKATGVLGSGYETAMRYYSCFSFVGGLIYKKEAFNRYNSSKHDGSIYAQIYLACLMISTGCRVFSIYEPYVIKDIVVDNIKRNSYKDVIAKTWRDYKVETGGLPSVINVLTEAFSDAGVLNQSLRYYIFRRIYSITFPFWLVDYRSNNAFPAAIGLIHGLKPWKHQLFFKLNHFNRLKIVLIYSCGSISGLLIPVSLFNRMKQWLYQTIKS